MRSGFAGVIRSRGAIRGRGGDSPRMAGVGADVGILASELPPLGAIAVPIELAGDIDLRGGAGEVGGAGGALVVHAEALHGSVIRLLGYAAIEANGGAGALAGRGGAMTYDARNVFGTPMITRFVYLDTDIALRGGDSTGNGIAGGGGRLVVEIASDGVAPSAASSVPSIRTRGRIDVSGGAGGGMVSVTDAAITMLSPFGIDVSGDLLATGSVGANGDGGELALVSTSGDVRVAAAISASGRDRSTVGARGGVVELSGRHVTYVGVATLAGGSGGTSGGAGGAFFARSTAATSAISSDVVVRPGDAPTPGAPGVVVVDGVVR